MLLAAATLACACGGGNAQAPAPARTTTPPPPPKPTAAADPLGPRPIPGPPARWTPPTPVVYKHPRGMTVWLVERHALPIVSIQTVVPAGAAQDPADEGGLAWATSNMLDEGAGTRGPLEIARDVDRLGATLTTGTYADYAFAHLTVLKKNLAAAAAIYGDVLAKPTFSPVEWKRVHGLWTNELVQRRSEPSAVAAVVVQAKVFGAGDPYGHPTDGTTKSAAKVSLVDVKKFYAEWWRPDQATCVVVGDVTRAELDPLLDSALAAWKAPAGGHGVSRAFGRPPQGRRVLLVDRPDAPQSVIAVGRPGVSARDVATAAVTRVNAALGGSFTSRLNQDLREEHGWSYGARSRFSFTADKGIFVAQAAVHTEHTGEALHAMLADIDALAKEGLTDEEVEKTRLLARSELVEAFEGVDGAAARLARNAGVGLPADFEAKRSAAIDAASKDELRKLAATHLDTSSAAIVVVGPRAKVQPQLEKIGLGPVEAVGPEGE